MEEKSLSGMINAKTADAFTEQSEERGYKKKRALEGAAKAWVGLPSDIQSKILTQETPGEAWVVILDLIQKKREKLFEKIEERHRQAKRKIKK